MTLQALVRNFPPINNFATLTSCAEEAHTTFPKDMSEVILKPAPQKYDNGERTPQHKRSVCKIVSCYSCEMGLG
jgi:hypothetical protein